MELAWSDCLQVLHHDGADVALASVAENDVTTLLSATPSESTHPGKKTHRICMLVSTRTTWHVSSYVCYCNIHTYIFIT